MISVRNIGNNLFNLKFFAPFVLNTSFCYGYVANSICKGRNYFSQFYFGKNEREQVFGTLIEYS